MQKSFFKKIIFSLGIFFAFSLITNQAQAAVLLPGNISTCGELASPGTYTLSGNITGTSNTCFTISSDNVVITGAGHIISGTGDTAIDARARSGEGTALVEGGNGYTNLVVNDVTITGYTNGINISGNADTTGTGVNNGYAGDAGDVAIYYSVVGNVTTNGGNSSTKASGGLGGNISFTDTNLNIASSTISALGGSGTSGSNTNGGLDLNYSGTITKNNVTLSALSFFNDNATSYGVYPGGSWPFTPGNISTCGTLYGTGTYTLTSNISNISGSCFIIATNGVTIDGAGYYISPANASTTAFAISAGSYATTTITFSSTTAINFSNLITSSSSVVITGNNLDLSNKYIAAGSLNLTYTGNLNYKDLSFSDLSDININGTNYGSLTAGSAPILAGNIWNQKTPAGSRSWYSVTSSADGTKLAAVVYGSGYIYTSTDSGVTWTERTSSGSRNWYGISSSADGTKLAAVVQGGYIYTSTDGGVTWSTNGNSSGSKTWYSIASSADGTKLAALVNGGYIYTSNSPFPVSDVKIISPVSGTTNVWSPFVSWNTNVSCSYSYDDWATSHSVDCSLAGSDILKPVSYGSSTLSIKGVDVSGNITEDSVSFNLVLGLNIVSPVDGSTIASTGWAPSVTWDPSGAGDITSCLYSYDNFTSTSTANCALGGSDILSPNVLANSTSTLTVRVENSNNDVLYASSTFNYTTWTYGGSFNFWYGSAGVSADGLKMYIGGNANSAGPVMRSIDGGVTWLNTNAGNRSWQRETAVSSDGLKVIMPEWGGGINLYSTIDAGANWVAKTFTAGIRFMAITGSSDGINLVGVQNNGYVFTSSDSGVSWTRQTLSGSRNWQSVTSSSDGQKLAATVINGNIYTSTDSGVTWTVRTLAGVRSWGNIVSSSDGSRLASFATNGYVYTSTDSGATWATSTTSGLTNFDAAGMTGITMSADGTKLLVTTAHHPIDGGSMYISNDFGTTWTLAYKRTGDGWSSGNNWALGIPRASADFTRILVPVGGGQVYTYYNPTSLAVNILRPSSGNTVNTWDPYVSFGISQTCQYSWDNTDWHNISCSSAGSDIPNPGYGAAQTLYVKGTDVGNNTISKQVNFNLLQASTSTNLTACGTISAPGTYTLTTNITGATSTCFRILSNNVTIDGAGHTVTATSSVNQYAIVATTTVAAYTNITVKNITFTGFNGGGINASGIPLGSIAGFGGSVTVSTSTMGAILVSGANGVGNALLAYPPGWQSGGHAGSVIVNNSTVGAITANGGNSNSYWHGIAGSAGAISVSSSTVSGNITATGGNGGFLCGHITAGSGGNINILSSSVTGTITSQGGQEGNNCSTVTFPGANSGTINIATSTVSGTITSQGGRGAGVDRTELQYNNVATVGGNASSITIANSTVANVVSQGGAGGPNTQINKNGPNGGNGGDITITNSVFGNVTSLGGLGGQIYLNDGTNGSKAGTGGNSGNIIITGSALDFSGKNIYGLGGFATGTGATLGLAGASGNLSLNYTSSFSDPALHSPFTQVLIYRPDGQVQAGSSVASTTLLSSLPLTGYATPGNISSCGNIYFSGTYTLTGDITNASSTCFTILADDVTIDGNGYSVSAGFGNVGYGIESTGRDGTIVKNITFTGFGGGVINSNQGVTFEDTDLDVSGISITAGNLTFTYSNLFTALNTTLSALSNLFVNDIDLGAFAGGLFNWGTYSLSSCGQINNPGSYNLTQDIFESAGNSCLDINTDLVYINGNGHNIYTTASTSAYAINATQNNGAGYSNISLKNVIISGFGGGIDSRGATGFSGGNIVLDSVITSNTMITANTSATTTFDGAAGNGGDITVVASTIGHLYANGGDGVSTTTLSQGGHGGSISLSNNSSVGNIQSSGGNTTGDINPGTNLGTISGGAAGTYSTSFSTAGTVTRNAGSDYVPGCTLSSYLEYDPSAIYNDGSCATPSSDLWTPHESNRRWIAITSSADGTRLAAADSVGSNYSGGYIYISTDSGATWSPKGSPKPWTSITSSADGMVLAATADDSQMCNYSCSSEYIYVSTDGGETWEQKGDSLAWMSITSSADGTTLAAAPFNGNQIYISNDSGATWTLHESGRYWKSITSSADGTKLAAVDMYGPNWDGGQIYTSTDSGITWTPHESERYWSDITSSADGTKLAAVVQNGYIYTSADGGDTWTERTSVGSKTWYSITSSADGMTIAAVDYNNGQIYISIDGGDTWNAKESNRNWWSITSSSDGTKLAAVDMYGSDYSGGYIYTTVESPRTLKVDILLPSANATTTEWKHIVSWGSATSCYYSYDNFSTQTEVGCSNNGSDILAPASAGNVTLYVKGIDVSNNIDTASSTFNLVGYYFCGTADSDWNNNTNWYSDADCSVSATTPISNGNIAFVVGTTSPIIDSSVSVVPNNIITTGMTGAAATAGVIFGDSVNYTGIVTGNATFNNTSYNSGIVTGNAMFNTTHYNSTAPTGGVLSLGSGDTYTGNVLGSIYGSDSNVISNIVFNGTASNNGTINGSATFNGTTFRMGTVNGTATLNGIAQTIQGVNNVINFVKNLFTQSNDNGRDTLYLTAGSTINVSGLFTLFGTNANNLLTVRSTTPGSYANIVVSGTSNFNYLRLKDIRNTASTLNLSTKTVYDDGHNSGFNFPTNSTPGSRNGITGSYSAPALPVSRGGIAPSSPTVTNTPTRTSSGILRNLNPFGKTVFTPLPTVNFFTPQGGIFTPNKVGNTVIPFPFQNFKPVSPLVLIPSPKFIPNVSQFLFAPLPTTITQALKDAPKLQNFIAAAGVNTEQSLAVLATKPLPLKDNTDGELTPGHFIATMGIQPITTFVTYDANLGGLAELIKVSTNQQIKISLVPLSTGEVTATYLNQALTFTKGKSFYSTTITTPFEPGRYVLKTASSPVPLIIEVTSPQPIASQQQTENKPWGIFNFVWKLFNK